MTPGSTFDRPISRATCVDPILAGPLFFPPDGPPIMDTDPSALTGEAARFLGPLEALA